MKNKKSTKRTLLSSVLSLVLCMAMLIGTTFAWFTDSVTSAGNTIQSGTLKVDLVDGQDNSLAGKIIKFVDKDDNDLWEPGCTYETEPVYVKNNGNLALKYQIAINGIDGNAKLLEAIEWTVTVDGTTTPLSDLCGALLPETKSGAIVLSGHMKEEAGNEYQGLTAEGISIVVSATQVTSESDSFNNEYDKDAVYAAQTMLKKVAAVAAGESATVKLESDGYVVLSSDAPVGAQVKGNVTLDMNGKTLFVKAEDVTAGQYIFEVLKDGSLTVTGNGTIKMVSGKNPSHVTAMFLNNAGTLVIENGTYDMDHMANWEDSLIPTIIDTNNNVGAATTTINGGTFYHTRNMFRNFAQNRVNAPAKLVINGGTFNGEPDDWATIWNQKTSSGNAEGSGLVEINGGTFNYVEINNGYETGVNINNDVVMPVAVSNDAELQEALNSAVAGDVIVLMPGKYGTIVAKSNITLQGTLGAVVDAVNLNGSKNVTLKNIEFNAAGAQAAYYQYNNDKVQIYANIVSGSKTSQVGARNIVIDGCTFEGKFANGGAAIAFTDRSRPTGGSADVIVKNCTFNTENAYYDVYGYYTGSPDMTFTIENNVFADNCQACPIYLGRLATSEAIVVKGNTFKTTDSLENSVYIQAHSATYEPTLDADNNTFSD